MSDRIFAGLWLAFCAAVAAIAWKIEAPFSYEPIGPRAYPILVTGMMAASAAWLLVKPDPEPDWPRGTLARRCAVLFGAFLGYAVLFETLGFPVSTALATMFIGRIFGGGWKGVTVAGAVLGTGLWFFFDKLLDVTLPLGRLWAGA